MPDPLVDAGGLDRAPPFVLYRVARLLRHRLAQFLERESPGLSPEQWFHLFRLYERDGCAQTELTDATLDDRPNVTRLLAGLEQQGYVRRSPDPDDRRRILVYLTRSGRALVARLLPTVVEERMRIFEGLSPREVSRLLRSLAVLESNLRTLTSSADEE